MRKHQNPFFGIVFPGPGTVSTPLSHPGMVAHLRFAFQAQEAEGSALVGLSEKGLLLSTRIKRAGNGKIHIFHIIDKHLSVVGRSVISEMLLRLGLDKQHLN